LPRVLGYRGFEREPMVSLVDTANELIIAYGSKPVAREAWQETIGCIIHNTKDKSNIRYANHIVELQITRGT